MTFTLRIHTYRWGISITTTRDGHLFVFLGVSYRRRLPLLLITPHFQIPR